MANEPTIEAMNLEIVEFMQVEKDHHSYLTGGRFRTTYLINGYWLPLRKLKYHASWDWLMPVVEKIESIYDDFHGYFGVHISSNGCTIQGTKFNTTPGHEHYAYFNDVTHETKILATHYAVFQFITWYNQQKQTNA